MNSSDPSIGELADEIEKQGWNTETLEANDVWRDFTQEILAEIINRVFNRAFPSGTTVLELGSGHGRLRSLIAGDYTYLQLEPSWSLCHANSTGPVGILCAVGEAIPVKSGSLDAVVALTVLDILHDGRAVMAEVARVLKPGGVFIHFHDLMPNLTNILARDSVLILPYCGGEKVDGYQVLWRSQLVKRLRELDSTARTIIETCLEHPMVGEGLGYSYELIDLVSRDLGKLKGLRRQVITDVMGEFDRQAARLAKRAGLKVVFSGGETATSIIPAERRYDDQPPLDPEVEEDIKGTYLEDLAKPFNLYITSLGKVETHCFDRELAAEIGPDKIFVSSTVHVFQAVKPA